MAVEEYHNEQTDLSRFWVKGHRKWVQFYGTHCRLTLTFMFVDATFRSGDMRCRVRKSPKSGPKFDVFLRPKFGEAPKFLGAFVNRHHFRPTGQIRLRSHGWSFIYADEIKKQR